MSIEEPYFWNDQMKQVWPWVAKFGLGGLALGAGFRAYGGLRDNSLAFGNTQKNLLALADRDDYLSQVNSRIQIPRKRRPNETVEADQELKDELVRDRRSRSKAANADEQNYANWIWDEFKSFSRPLKTFFRGSPNPTGQEKPWEIPATYALTPLAGLAGLQLGRQWMDGKINRVADAKVTRERDRARREFEMALIHEQEAAARRNKRAEETSELIQAIDEFYAAYDRYEAFEKNAMTFAGTGTAAPIAKTIITGTGILAALAGWNAFNNSYRDTRKNIEHDEKEKMLGLNTTYDDIYRDMGAANIEALPIRVDKRNAPKPTTRLIKLNS